jgi:hypothetical protein
MTYHSLSLKQLPRLLTLIAVLYCYAIPHAQASQRYGDDETILIEKEISTRLSYSAAFKSFSKHLLKFDIDSFFSGGKNCRDAVIRSFSDFSNRTKYRLNLKHDEVEVRFTLNF